MLRSNAATLSAHAAAVHLTALAVLFGLASCNSEPAPVQSAVTELYNDGTAKEKVLYRPDPQSEERQVVERRTYHSNGDLIKINPTDGSVQYYHNIRDTLLTRSGLRSFLRGTWRIQNSLDAFKDLPNGKTATVKTTEFRRFSGDTLTVYQQSLLRTPSGRKLVSRLKIAFTVRYIPPLRLGLKRHLYTETRGQRNKANRALDPQLQRSVIDTLQIYRPDLFAIHSDAPGPDVKRYARASIPFSLRAAFQD